jgi:alpha-glucosidase
MIRRRKLLGNFGIALALAAVAPGCKCICHECTNQVKAVSPDGRNEIVVTLDPLSYEVKRDGLEVVGRSAIGMKVNGRCLAAGAKVKSVETRELSGKVATPVYKKASVDLSARETVVDYGDWALRLIARDDGVAYRFETKMPGKIKVDCEKAMMTVPEADATCWLNFGGRFGCEETVPVTLKASQIVTSEKEKSKKHVYLPFVYSTAGKTVAVTESDVYDYPIWNLKRDARGGAVAFDSRFAGYPASTGHYATDSAWKPVKVEKGGRWVRVESHRDYLVETAGTRTFPWRTFVLADAPSKLCEADIVYALATPAAANADFSWVKPGKVAWDWWNGWDNLGEKDGCTTAGYKRFIDFAAKTGVEYVILDEGWSEKLNIWKFHPNVDVPEIIRYGNEKGVGIILWLAWAQAAGDEAKVASHFAKLGAKGFKVDFMDRGDAEVAGFLEKFAREAAKNRMIVDYHGAYRPVGMQRAYPNIVNYEGVHGLECTKWFKNQYDFMDNDIKQFFCRMTAGPMDYTPGAMSNYPIGAYKGTHVNPGSVGTRCRQMAMMAMYEAPLQMLCDAPNKYEKNMESFSFMAGVPVVWDDTVGLGGCPDSFAAVARRKGDVWYAAAMTNAEGRDFLLDTSFLGSGTWKAEMFRDAPESDTVPEKFVHERFEVKAGARLPVKMAKGGGFVVRFTK